MTEAILVPGGRDVRAALDPAHGDSIDGADGTDDTDDATTGREAIAIARPPHPQQQGHRGNTHLVAVSDALTARGVDCLRFGYGAWDEGYGERADTLRAVKWAAERYDYVGLFGFSFGGTMAPLVAAEGTDVGAIPALGPVERLADDLNAVTAFDRTPVPVQVVYDTHDDIADWKPVVERVQGYHQSIIEFAASHFFIGQEDEVAAIIADFLVSSLGVK